MSYRNERLNKSMRSLEDAANGIDMSKWRVLSDAGVGVERMVEEIDGEEKKIGGESRWTMERKKVGGESRWTVDGLIPDAKEVDRDERLWVAEMRLAEAGKSYLIRVLLLIVENGRHRENSINALTAFSKNWNAARKKYFEHRDRLVEFFKSDSAAHGDIEGHAMPHPASVNKINMNRCGGRADIRASQP